MFASFILVSALLFISLYSLSLIFFSSRKNSTSASGGNKQQHPPGSSSWSFISETIEYIRASLDGVPEKFFFERFKKYSSQVFTTSLFGETVVVIGGTASGNKFLFSNEYKLINTWFPKSILEIFPFAKTNVGNPAGHKSLRKLYSQLLNPESVHKYIGVMDLMTAQHFETDWDKNMHTDEVIITVQPLVKKHSFAIACRLFLGIDYQQEASRIHELHKLFCVVMSGFLSLPINLPGTQLNRAIKSSKLIRQEIQKAVRKRKINVLSHGDSPMQDMLSRLIDLSEEEDRGIDEMYIVELMVGIIFGGITSMGVVLTLVMNYLADFPNVYKEVLKEQMEVASSKGTRELLNWDDIQKMKYSWNVVREVMRVATPSPVGFKRASEDFWYDGYFIPKGRKLVWSSAATHMSPDYFPDPEKFDPSRFEGDGPAPYTFIPFGGGPSLCPGQEYARLEILVFLHHVVRRYKWDKPMPTDVNKEEKIVFKPYPLLTKGLAIHIRPHL
ncbi:hypothetical protein MKW98_002782 [Papaver atlanticum]|uniref:Cytochrome P450 n=1 Tax=Papaver atlanticum TaxID=357466 RepID=A0AAD4TEP9_9MAGN|nr:hypothetical protein MKW98_002782 [Papaver atlanticum]